MCYVPTVNIDRGCHTVVLSYLLALNLSGKNVHVVLLIVSEMMGKSTGRFTWRTDHCLTYHFNC